MNRALRKLLVLAAICLGSLALAAPAAPATRAVVAFLNLLDPHMVSVAKDGSSSEAATATALLGYLVTGQVLDPQVAAALDGSLGANLLPRDPFVLFLVDVANGGAVLGGMTVAEAEAWLSDTLGISVPPGSDGMLSAADVAAFIAGLLEQGDRLAAELRRSYQSPVL